MPCTGVFSTGLLPAGRGGMCSKTSAIDKCTTTGHKGLLGAFDFIKRHQYLLNFHRIELGGICQRTLPPPGTFGCQSAVRASVREEWNVWRCLGGQGQARHWLCSWSAPVLLRDAEMVARYFCGKCLRTVLVWNYTWLFARFVVSYKFLPAPSSFPPHYFWKFHFKHSLWLRWKPKVFLNHSNFVGHFTYWKKGQHIMRHLRFTEASFPSGKEFRWNYADQVCNHILCQMLWNLLVKKSILYKISINYYDDYLVA